MKKIAYIVSVLTVLVGIGITYGLAKGEIDQLKEEVRSLKTLVVSVAEVKTDVQWIKAELQSQKKERKD